jgi:hypothetical protein
MSKPINWKLTKALIERDNQFSFRSPWTRHQKVEENPDHKPRTIVRHVRKGKITLATRVTFLDKDK